jgi:hypothetical protein
MTALSYIGSCMMLLELMSVLGDVANTFMYLGNIIHVLR